MARPRKTADIGGEDVQEPQDAPEMILSEALAQASISGDAPTAGAAHAVLLALYDLKARAAGQPHLPADIAERIAKL